ncbi:MAG: hypothetical protein R3B82_23300 [Sandaracinaceae bacterium]
MRHAWRWLLALTLLSCAEPSPETPDDDKPEEGSMASGVDSSLRIGHVMVEVGHRLETSGRAAEAANWGLAIFEVQELIEMFETDMTRALLPGDCNDTIADSAYEELLSQLPVMQEAAENENLTGFREHFATASATCNGCHAGCNVAFIRVPSTAGAEVPMIDLRPPAPPEPVETPPEPAVPTE